MTRVFVARHAEPEKSLDVSHTNWPLSRFGRNQADFLGERCEGFGFVQVITSPALRCRQTAEAVAKRLNVPVKVEPRLGEIVPPKGTQDVYAWLLQNFAFEHVRYWSELDASLNKWRDDNIKAMSEIKDTSVVITHFTNINAIMGAALHLKNTMSCRPEYVSLTDFAVVNGDIRLVMEGTEIKGPNE